MNRRVVNPWKNSLFVLFRANKLKIVMTFDKAKWKLKNACELTLLTDYEDNATNLEHKLVKIKFVKFNSSIGNAFLKKAGNQFRDQTFVWIYWKSLYSLHFFFVSSEKGILWQYCFHHSHSDPCRQLFIVYWSFIYTTRSGHSFWS